MDLLTFYSLPEIKYGREVERMRAYSHTRIQIYTYIRMYACLHTRTYGFIHIQKSIHIYVCLQLQTLCKHQILILIFCQNIFFSNFSQIYL